MGAEPHAMDARPRVISASEVVGVLTQPSLDPGPIPHFAYPAGYAKRKTLGKISNLPGPFHRAALERIAICAGGLYASR